MPKRYYLSRHVCEGLHITRESLKVLVAQGKFPAPFKFGGRLMWDADVVDRHLADLSSAPVASAS
jgi:hypothetical protein